MKASTKPRKINKRPIDSRTSKSMVLPYTLIIKKEEWKRLLSYFATDRSSDSCRLLPTVNLTSYNVQVTSN